MTDHYLDGVAMESFAQLPLVQLLMHFQQEALFYGLKYKQWFSYLLPHMLCLQNQYQDIVKVPGTFRLSARNEHLYS